jgi:hypothetical protein
VHALFAEHDVGHGHGRELDVFGGEDARAPRLLVAVEEDVLLALEGALDVLGLEAEVALDDDLDPGEGQLLRAAF